MAEKNLPGFTGELSPASSPSSDLHLEMGVVKKHKHNRQHHRERPCPNPPAVPTGIVFTVRAVEAGVHLRFRGKLKWNEVEQDEQGHGTKISWYECQFVACDEDGVPVDLEDSASFIHIKRKQPAHEVNIKTATNPSGTTYRFVTRTNHGQSLNNEIIVKGCSPQTQYNGSWTVSNVVNDTTLEVVGSNSGLAECKEPGRIIDADDTLHVTTHVLERPKTWYWKARIRAVDRQSCRGDWSDWQGPILPWTGADPRPPAPTFTDPGAVTFDRIERGRHEILRLLFTFNEVVDWDVPGGDRESDVEAYHVQLDRSDDGVTWDGRPYRTHHLPAKDADSTDADDTATTRTAIFKGIRRRYWYRVRVRTQDRFGRRGDWSDWTTEALPFDDTSPPAPVNVRIFQSATDRVVLDWDDPTVLIPTRGTVAVTAGSATVTGTGTKFGVEVDAGDRISINSEVKRVKSITSNTSLTVASNFAASADPKRLFLVEDDPDVAFYKVQIAKAADVDLAPSPNVWQDVYMGDRTRGNRKAFKIPDDDRGLTYYGRVWSVDAAFNRSKPIPGTIAGNSDYTADGDGILIGSGGGGKIVATFTKPGRLRVRHYPYKWVNTTGVTLTFKKARATLGDREAGTGTPQGQAVKLNLRRWQDPTANSHQAVFQTGGGSDDDDRLRIAVGEYRDVNGPNTFEITTLEPDEAITLKVAQIGTTFPGEDLVVQVFMEP